MAQKLFKVQTKKIATKKTTGGMRSVASATPQEIVLVGTYKEKQLTWIKKNGVYNYPVKDGDEFDAEAFAKIKELWLYADTKGRRYCFAADFVKKMTQAEFVAAYPTYAKLGKSKSKAYYVFKTSFLEYGPKLKAPIVLARGADFGGRSAKVKKAIEAFKAGGEFGSLADFLPSELSQVPRERLRVCDGGAAMSVWSPVKGMTPQLEKIESIVMSIAMFAKARNVTVARAYRSLARNGVIAHLDEHYEIESCLPIEHIVSDMEGMCGIYEESVR